MNTKMLESAQTRAIALLSANFPDRACRMEPFDIDGATGFVLLAGSHRVALIVGHPPVVKWSDRAGSHQVQCANVYELANALMSATEGAIAALSVPTH